MTQHYRFPDIIQYRQVIRAVQHKARFVGLDPNGDAMYNALITLPTIKYRGTIKLHGSCSAICQELDTNEISIQSREQIISIENDNYGFAKFVSSVDVEKLFSLIPSVNVDNSKVDEEDRKNCIIIYGEWCGGSIQKGVAITQLEKMFVIFAIRYKGVWLFEDERKNVKLPDQRIFNILDFPSFEMDIDFQNPEISQNKLIEITQTVEQECPFAKTFGVSGIGEGVVWASNDPAWNSSRYWFKVKGPKHSASNTKQMASVDIEKVNSINEFLDQVVTENRLNQGVGIIKSLKKVEQLDRTHMGDLIRWVYNDVIKEEKDTMEASGLNEKDLGGPLAKRAREWLFKQGI
jgi:hypothetical protein